MKTEGHPKRMTIKKRTHFGQGWVYAVVLFMCLAGAYLTTAAGRSTEAMSSAPVTYNTIIYVSPFGSDSNDGSSWSSAKATLAAALAALPNCTATDPKGNSWTFPCGQIEAYTGTMAISSPVTITSPFISIIGRGSASTQFTWNGSGCAITVNEDTDYGALFPGPTLRGFSINGTGDSNSNSCGLHYEGGSHPVLRDVTIDGFTSSGDSCLYGSPGMSVEERAVFEHLYLGNCTVAWLLQNTRSSFVTIGYGNFDMYIDVGPDQTGIESRGNGASADLRLMFSVFHVILNSDSPSSTCMALSNYSYWTDDTGVLRCDGPSQGIHIDNTSYLFFGGDFDSDSPFSVSNGGHLVIQETAQDPKTGYDALEEWEKATANHPGTGPNWAMMGQYWNGNTSTTDEWKFQQVPSQDASDLTVQHTAGPKTARFDVPELGVIPGGVFGGYQTNIVAQNGGDYTFTLPAASGIAALSGANGVSAGTITLSGGSGSHMFGKSYSAAPVCTATDTSSASPVKVTSTLTAVYATGADSDVINWICAPAAN